jgi:HNH endonuclease
MRSLVKTAKPKVLGDNEEGWTKDYLAAVANGNASDFEKWRHREIKEALREEVKAKCAYCEGFVDDVSYPHVEHIIPKSISPELAHRWNNLTSACARCNLAKLAYYGEGEDRLLNPYTDDLAEHLHFLGSLIQWGLGSGQGEITVRRLKLNRLDLANARAKRLEAIRDLLERWHIAQGSRRVILEDSLRLDAEEGEFSGVVIAYLRAFGFPV